VGETDSGQKSLVVTGAAGALGWEIVRQAALRGFPVRAVDCQDRGTKTGAEFHRVDILEPNQLRIPLAGARVVVHAAGLTPYSAKRVRDDQYRAVNVVGTSNVTRIAVEGSVPRIVLVSSVAVYGDRQGELCTEESRCTPANAYARSKLEAEEVARALVEGTSTRLIILRMTTIYGVPSGNVSRLARRVCTGRFVWLGDGNNKKHLLHVEDAARACLLAALHPSDLCGVFNVVASSATMREIVQAMAKEAGVRSPGWRVPGSLVRSFHGILGAIPLAGGRRFPGYHLLHRWLSDDSFDGSSFSSVTGFTSGVSLGEGIRREICLVSRKFP
jgi:nucleoside-diphosphate-sugar epimerase